MRYDCTPDVSPRSRVLAGQFLPQPFTIAARAIHMLLVLLVAVCERLRRFTGPN